MELGMSRKRTLQKTQTHSIVLNVSHPPMTVNSHVFYTYVNFKFPGTFSLSGFFSPSDLQPLNHQSFRGQKVSKSNKWGNRGSSKLALCGFTPFLLDVKLASEGP